MCIAQTPAWLWTASGNIAGSPSSPVTSLMISAPAAKAAAATTALLVSIESGNPTRADHSLDDGQHTIQLSLSLHRSRIGAGAFAADVQDVRSLGHELQGMRDRLLGLEELPPIRKTIGRDIDDPHHQRPAPQRQRASAELPRCGSLRKSFGNRQRRMTHESQLTRQTAAMSSRHDANDRSPLTNLLPSSRPSAARVARSLAVGW